MVKTISETEASQMNFHELAMKVASGYRIRRD
jgi:hypothetical protein